MYQAILFAFLIVSLSGCSSIKESLGMSAAPVDPYMVEPQDLSLPPDYAIHPPRKGEVLESSQAASNTKSVESALKKA